MSQLMLLNSASLIGLTLLVLPIVAHLINFKTRREIVFPTTDRLQTSSPFLSQWRSLRDLLVLLLRCLVVVALVLAVGNLSCTRAADSTPESSSRPVVVLIDDHLTTQLTTLDGSIFTQLQRLADDELASRTGAAAIVWSTRQPTAAAWRDDVNVARMELLAHTESYLDADLPAAWQTVRRLLREQGQPCDVVVVTDRTADAWEFALRGEQSMALPAGTHVSLRSPEFDALTNIAITRPTITPALGSAMEPRTVAASIAYRGEEPVRVTVQLRTTGAEPQVREVTLTPDDESVVSFDFTPAMDTDTIVRLRVGDDAFGPDNELLAMCRVSASPRVRVVAPPARSLTARRLQLAARVTATGDQDSTAIMAPGALATASLEHVDHVLLVVDSPLSADAQIALERFLFDGGQVLIWPTGNRALGSDAWPDSWPRVGDAVRAQTLQIAQLDARHPVTRIFTGASEAALKRTEFQQSRTIAAGEGAIAPLAFADGSAAMTVQSVGAGRLIVVAFDIDADASLFSRTGLFVALLQQALVTHARTAAPVASDVGQPVSMTIPLTAAEGDMLTPTGEPSDNTTVVQTGNTARVTLPLATMPGVYSWQSDGAPVAQSAVNVPASSTRFDRLPPDALLQALADAVQSDDNAGMPATSTRSLAWLCVLVALACMAGEFLIATQRDR